MKSLPEFRTGKEEEEKKNERKEVRVRDRMDEKRGQTFSNILLSRPSLILREVSTWTLPFLYTHSVTFPCNNLLMLGRLGL